MSILSIRRKRCFLLFLLYLLFSPDVFGRDIDMDEIYISNAQGYLSKLSSLKHNAYQILKSTPVDSNVIFAGWVSGNRLVYVKEYINADINEIYEYYPSSRIKKRMATVKGAVIHSKISLNGHYLFLKVVYVSRNSVNNEIVILNLRDRFVRKKRSLTPLLDFTVSYHGDSLFYENGDGITEYFPDDGSERLILPKDRYSRMMSNSNCTLAYVSPMRNRILLVNGGGGLYDSVLLQGRGSRIIEGISSSSEIWWLDNSRIIYRSGSLARYHLVQYNAETGSSEIKSDMSLNTNISYSPFDRYVSYNLDGIISFYFSRYDDTRRFPVEGEDISFSPDGQVFLSLFQKRLYLSRYSALQESQLELRRNSAEILTIYRRLRNSGRNLLNEYSDEYIRRKISVYEMVTH